MITQSRGYVRPTVASTSETHCSLLSCVTSAQAELLEVAVCWHGFHRVSGLWLFALSSYSIVFPLNSSQAEIDGDLMEEHLPSPKITPLQTAMDLLPWNIINSTSYTPLLLLPGESGSVQYNNQFSNWPAVTIHWLWIVTAGYCTAGILNSGTDNMQTGQDRSCSCRVCAQSSVTVPFPFQSTQKRPKEERKSQKSI